MRAPRSSPAFPPWIAWRSLAHGRARTGLAALAIAASIALVLLFEGLAVGLYRQARQLPSSLPADLVVVQAGVENMLGSRSVLPGIAREHVESVRGVRAVHPLTGAPLIFRHGVHATPIFVIAYDTAGGPASLLEGRPIERAREVVFDAALARTHGLRPGDEVEILGHAFTLAGLSLNTTSMFNPYVFVRVDDVLDIALERAAEGETDPEKLQGLGLSYLLVQLDPAADARAVRAAIEAAEPDGDVLTPAELAEHDEARTRRIMGPILRVLVGVSWAVAALAVGLTLLASVSSRLRGFAVMKALGASSARLGATILSEALALVAGGAAIGLVLGRAAAMVLAEVLPKYPIEAWAPPVLLRSLAGALLAAAVGALLPFRSLGALDPAVVFRR